MSFYTIDGDPAGEMGSNTILDTSVHPPRVSHIHYVIDAWTGSDLVETFPCYLATDRLAAALAESGLGSFEFGDAEITIEPEGIENRDDAGFDHFPEFRWWRVTGTAGRDDVGVDSLANLVVSERALQLLRQFNLDGCKVENFAG